MPKVTVFKIKCFDVIKGEERILGRLATRSGARLLGDGFEIIEGTGMEVDASQLERDETWTQSDFTPCRADFDGSQTLVILAGGSLQ